MDKQNILGEIRRTADENGGKPLGLARFENRTGISEREWGKHWARWGDAPREAGYKPNTLQGAYNEDYLLEKLKDLVLELGKFPVARELKLRAVSDGCFPSANVFQRRWKKAEMARALISYCETVGGLQRVIEICEPVASAASKDLRPPGSTLSAEVGFVYLIKSGKYFKIGLTRDLGRRVYDLRIALPEKPTLIHTIETDDPEGIEQYWHKRFKSKRKGGEWFDLSPSDVSTFKRRKFM